MIKDTDLQAEIDALRADLAELRAQLSRGVGVPDFLSASNGQALRITLGVPTWGALGVGDLALTGTATSATVARGDGSWADSVTGNWSVGGDLYGTQIITPTLAVSGSVTLPANTIARSWLTNGMSCSIVGRSANSSGALADIQATTNDRILARVSNALTWTQVTAGMLPNNVVVRAALAQGSARSVIGVTGNATANVADIQSSAARQFMASNSGNTGIAFRAIEAADLPGGNWITATSSQAVLASAVSLAANATWYTVADLSLAAGTYLLIGTTRNQFAVSAGTGFCVAELFNVTSGVSVSNSQVLTSITTSFYNGTTTNQSVVTIGSTSTLRLRAKRESVGATFTSASVESDIAGYSKIVAIRLA